MVAVLDTALASPVSSSLARIVWNSPRILQNLVSRMITIALSQQRRKEMRVILFKLALARRKFVAGPAKVEVQEKIAFDAMFNGIDIPEKTRRMMSWSLKLQAAYRPQLWEGNLLLLRASQRPLFGPFGRDLGWGPHVRGRVIVANFPCDHSQPMEHAQMRAVAELLNETFDQQELESSGPRGHELEQTLPSRSLHPSL